ncbi:MAG: hypothetical protein DME08_22160 [Candidatus Rokuibacteriota bacterium]|nr:MAG: hypothetical protein DME08_22160 [Candidatus Rokubacteria bacterium]
MRHCARRRRPGAHSDRRLPVAHGYVCEARQVPARGVSALPEGSQCPGRIARAEGRVRRLRRSVDAAHRRTPVRKAPHRGQGRRRVMGPYSSPVTEAVANVTEKYKKVMVAPLAATTGIFRKEPRRKYIFMVLSPAEVYFDGLTDIATKRGLKTVAVVNEDTLFSKAAAAGAVNLAKKKGMQVVFQEAYPKGNTDFSGLLTKIKGVNPDVLAAATYFDDAVALTRQMRELNVNPKMYGVTIGGDLPEFYDTLKGNAEYVYGATQWEPALNYPGNREFVESYRAEFKREPSYFAAAGYAGCLVYTEGVKRAGSLDADKVREHILKLDLRTPFGEFKVDPDGVQLAHKMVTFQWQKEKKVIVWPDDLAQGKVLFPTPPWTSR